MDPVVEFLAPTASQVMLELKPQGIYISKYLSNIIDIQISLNLIFGAESKPEQNCILMMAVALYPHQRKVCQMLLPRYLQFNFSNKNWVLKTLFYLSRTNSFCPCGFVSDRRLIK